MQTIATITPRLAPAPVGAILSPSPKPKPPSTTSDGWWPAHPDYTGPRINLAHHPSLPAAAAAVQRLNSGQASGVVLAGGTGSGKTELARIIMHANYPAYCFYPEPLLLDHIRDSYTGDGPAHILRRCIAAPLLVLDDIGAGYVRGGSDEWYESLMWRIIDGRQGKKTLITTNFTSVDLRNRIGFRCVSRIKELLGERANFVNLFDVTDYRERRW